MIVSVRTYSTSTRSKKPLSATMGKIAGFVAAAIAGIFFGSNYIPCKKYDVGDGMYFQFVMAVGIWLLGLIVFLIQQPETGYFSPYALLGGLLWSIGNVLTVPIIKCIGMALGLSIWSGTNLVVGWIFGKYGIMGYTKDDSVKVPWLNYLGLVLQLISLSIFFFVQPNDETVHDKDKYGHIIPYNEAHIMNPNLGHMDSTAILNVQHDVIEHEEDKLRKKDMLREQEKVRSFVDKLKPRQKQVLGIVLALIAGCCYGLCFSPAQHLINDKHNRDPSQYPYANLEQYAFSHYCGILLSSIVWFAIYCIYTRNRPQINEEATFPSIISGFIWAIAFTGFFTAMDEQNLGPEVTFPIVGGTPQIVASLWGVCLFKEVKPGKNMFILAAAVGTGIAAVACIAGSKLINA